MAITTITSHTFFDQSNKPLTMWFRAIWWMIAQKNGVSASGLQTILGIGSYKTAWIWLHKLRMLMVFPNRDKLSGKVEIDETFVGGVAEGKRGRGAENKSLVMIAVEVLPKGTGRVRLELIPSAEGKHLLKFISENVEKGTSVITDGWTGYAQLGENGYEHIKQKQVIASNNEEMLPNVHRIAALLKRWLLGTHQNYTSQDRLQKYLDEFSFRYNRRKSNSRGLLFHRIIEQAMIREPILSRDVLENKI
jgi:transposase-like protein